VRGRTRTQVACRLHAVLCDLVPGGVSRPIYAARTARILQRITPPDAVAAARCELAAAFLEDLRRIDAQLRDTKKKLAVAVAATGTSLTGLFGVAPVIAAAVIGDARDVSRFPGRNPFAAYNGTAPIEVSSGPRKIYRLSRRGNRRLNHAIHMAAITQTRHRHSQGRACYDKKLAEGKTPKEALRSLKRQVSNAIFACLQADARRAAARAGGPGGQQGTTLSPARPAHTPGTGSSDQPLPDLITTLRPRPPAPRPDLQVPGAELAIPRSLPPRRRRRRGSRWSARSAARTNDLEARQDDDHTRPRGRPRAKIPRKRHSARRAPHPPRKGPTEGLDAKRLSICIVRVRIDLRPAIAHI
jgi:transposase